MSFTLNVRFNSKNILYVAAAENTLPHQLDGAMKAKDESTRTKRLIHKRSKMNRRKNSKADYMAINEEIKESRKQDYKDWINQCVSEMEDANAKNNSRKVFSILNKLSKKPKPPPQNLKTNEQGKPLTSAKEAANVWLRFLKGKFAATDVELNERQAMDDIPNYRGVIIWISRNS